MSFRETAGSLEEYFLDYYGELEQVDRTPDMMAIEKELLSDLKPWAQDHRQRYKHTGVLPRLPDLFKDQRINVAGREVWHKPRWLPESAYVKFHKKVYAKAVGSAALADQIILSFKETPAFTDNPNISLAEYTIQQLDNQQSVAVVSGHLDRLTDITDLTDGLNLAIAEEYGLKYADKFKVVVNKLMAMESLYGLPVPWYLAVGLAPRWGSPEAGAKKWGISEAAQVLINRQLGWTLLRELRQTGQVVGMVPAGTAATLWRDGQGRLEKISLPPASGLTGLFPLYAGIIPANRWGEQFATGQVLPVSQPKDVPKKHYAQELTNEVSFNLAAQASELSGVVVEYERLKSGAATGVVAVKAAASQPALTRTE